MWKDWREFRVFQDVVPKFDDKTMKALAKSGDGKFINISTGDNVVSEIKNSLTNLESSSKKSRYTTYDSYFQWFVGAAFILFIIELFIHKNAKKAIL